MNRLVRRAAIWGWGAIILFHGVVQGQAPPSSSAAPRSGGGGPAQAPSSPTAAPRVGGGGPGEASVAVDALAVQMAERVRELSEAINADLGNTKTGPVLLQDARELSLAVDEFRQAQLTLPDALRRRQLYATVDTSWHHFMAEIAKADSRTPRVDAAVKQVQQLDGAMHRLIELNPYPSVYYGDKASLGGMREIQRLGRALVDRAEGVLAAIRAEIGGRLGTRLAEGAESLVQSADNFHDGIDLDARPDDITRNGFAGVAAAADTLGADLATLQLPERVRSAWRSYKTTETLMRQALKLPVREADLSASALPAGGRPPVQELADRLVAQTDDFLNAFTPEARNAPEGAAFIADARRLRAATADFRSEIPRALDVGQLAYAFQEVDALWGRLARRTNRIARGRPSPNLPRIEAIGQTVAEIHRLLGMPGAPASVGPFAAPG